MNIFKIDNNTLCLYKKILQDNLINKIQIETKKEKRDISIIKNITKKDLETKIYDNYGVKKKSYNAIILTNDNKIVFCTRRKSFYYDEFLQICKKNIKESNNIKIKILKLFSNLSIIEKKNILDYIYDKNNNNKKKYIKNYIIKIFKNKFIEEFNKYDNQYISTTNYNNINKYKLTNNFINANITINNDRKIHFNFDKGYNLLILPGGKNNNSENIVSVLNREIHEELGMYNILNDSQLYTTYYIENIIYDKIINKFFTDITFLIITNLNSIQLATSFKNNEDKREIQNLIFINIPPDISYDKLLLWAQLFLII